MTEADAAIIARVRAGDREAYAELVRRHAPVALRTAALRTAALLGAGPDAEDVVPEARGRRCRGPAGPPGDSAGAGGVEMQESLKIPTDSQTTAEEA